MRVLLVDDEAPARAELRFMLQSLAPDLTLLEAQNGAEALTLIEAEPPDVIFLDINLPALSGMSIASLLSNLPQPPLIVFATAHREYAVKAFDLDAFDYLLKPFDERRLARTVERLQTALADPAQKNPAPPEPQAAPRESFDQLWLERANENRVLVPLSDLYWFEARDKRVYARALMDGADEEVEVRYTLKELEASLGGQGFARIHKSHLVNLSHIRELVPWFSGNYLVRMNNAEATELTLSRRYAARLKEQMAWG